MVDKPIIRGDLGSLAPVQSRAPNYGKAWVRSFCNILVVAARNDVIALAKVITIKAVGERYTIADIYRPSLLASIKDVGSCVDEKWTPLKRMIMIVRYSVEKAPAGPNERALKGLQLKMRQY
ncbi:hypothetical protein ACH5RR_040889 [Cinchona calisaya]|uniref:Uncharacterized protein n=1 Tax=Cinchona calisaya TaxID=153742 RepID=A0ABD2XV10_9GENT